MFDAYFEALPLFVLLVFGFWRCRRSKVCWFQMFEAYLKAQMVYLCGLWSFAGGGGQMCVEGQLLIHVWKPKSFGIPLRSRSMHRGFLERWSEVLLREARGTQGNVMGAPRALPTALGATLWSLNTSWMKKHEWSDDAIWMKKQSFIRGHFTHGTEGPWPCTSSTLIGGKGGAGPSSLHIILEGLMERECTMDESLHGFLHDINWIMFHGQLVYFQKPLLGGMPN